MSARELIVFGSSADVPTKARAHNGYFLRWDTEGLLFDPGEGTQRQMIFAEVSATAITRVFITHFHGDHCLGLAGLCQRISLDRVPHTVKVYYPASGQTQFESLKGASIYHNMAKIEGVPIEREGPVYEDSKIVIEARALDHTIDCFGYQLREKDGVTMMPEKLAAAGITGRDIGVLQKTGRVEIDGVVHEVGDYSVEKRGHRFAFVMDTRPCDAARALAEDADLLLAEATYLSADAERAKAEGHMTAAQAAQLAKEAGAHRLLLGHFTPEGVDPEAVMREAKPIFERTRVAEDTQRYIIDRR